MVHQCRLEQQARAARDKKLNYGIADAVGDSNLSQQTTQKRKNVL